MPATRHVWVTEDLLRRLKIAAAIAGCTIGELIRQLLDEHEEREEDR